MERRLQIVTAEAHLLWSRSSSSKCYCRTKDKGLNTHYKNTSASCNNRYWPEYITQILWPFVLKRAEDQINNLHIDINGQTAEMRFSKSPTATVDLQHFHSFGCPCYILDARVQGNPKGLRK